MDKREKKREELGAVFDVCPKCGDRVNKTWIGKDMCIYCRQSGVTE